MKLVREHINEKFMPDSDPIKDMGIGSITWDTLKKGDILLCTKFVQTSSIWAPQGKIRHAGTTLYNKPKLFWIGNMFKPGEKYRVSQDPQKLENGKLEIVALDVKYGNGSCRIIATPRQLSNRFKIIQKYDVNEKFTEDSDPIRDLGIGIFSKRNFNTEKEFFNFILAAIPAILDEETIPLDIIEKNRDNPRRSKVCMNDKYFRPIDNFLEKYISFKEISLRNELCDIYLWNIPVAKFLKTKGYKVE